MLQGIETEYKELNVWNSVLLENGQQLVKPTPHMLGTSTMTGEDNGGNTVEIKQVRDQSWNMSIAGFLTDMIKFDQAASPHLLSWSKRYACGSASIPASGTYRSWEDGTFFREHAFLSKPEPGPKVIRVPLIGYADGVEVPRHRLNVPQLHFCTQRGLTLSDSLALQVCNMAGAYRGKHHVESVFVSPLSLPTELRFDHDRIIPVTITRTELLKKYDAVKVIAGVDSRDGKFLTDCDSTFGHQMRELAKGVDIGDGWTLKAYLVIFSADYPARGKYTPFASSVSSTQDCHDCHHTSGHKTSVLASFFAPNAAAPVFRTLSDTTAFLAQCKRDHGSSKTRLENALKVKGCHLTQLIHDKHIRYTPDKPITYVLEEKNFPGFDCVKGTGNDTMHLFGDGILKPETCGMLLLHIRRKMYTCEQVNQRIRALPKSGRWEHPGPIHPTDLEDGFHADGTLHSDIKLRYTASQMTHFVLYIHRIIRPLLERHTDGLQDPAWLSMCKMHDIVRIAHQHEIAESERMLLAQQILEHERLFDLVPEYKHLKKPKHHFLHHLPFEIKRLGPPRGYWCFGFEGFNQKVKIAAKRGNFKDVSKRIAKKLCAKRATRLARQRMRMRTR